MSNPFRPLCFNKKGHQRNHHHHPRETGDARCGSHPNDGLQGFEGEGIDPEKTEGESHEAFNQQDHPDGLVLEVLASRPKDEDGEPGDE